MRLLSVPLVLLLICAGLAACQDGGNGQQQASDDPVYEIYPNPDDPDSPPVYVRQSQLDAYYHGQAAPASTAGGYDDSQQQAYQQYLLQQQQQRAQQEQQQWFQQNYGAPGQ